MPARIHGLLVVRAEGGDAAGRPAARLTRTLDALRTQRRTLDALTVVVCGSPDAEVQEALSGSGAEGIVRAPRGTGYAAALRMATSRVPEDATAVWLLADDTAPDPGALQRLAGALEQPSVAIAAPKLVDWHDPETIVSLGITLTRLGRTVELAAGEHDQGQHDADSDALAADVRGLLIRRGAWDALSGVDQALAGADEGLDLGVRARLAGWRVALDPAARIAVGAGAEGRETSGRAPVRRRPAYAARTAQLHRRLVYAPAPVVALHWLSLLPLALWRTLVRLVGKQPARVPAEWAAAVTVMVRPGAVARARRAITAASRASGTRVPWSRLEPLRIRHGELRRRLDGGAAPESQAVRRSELRFFVGGGAWAVLAAAALGALVFFGLLAWPGLGGGALLPLRETVAGLWQDAAYGRRALGLDLTGPADPFAAVVALLGTLTPWNPSQAVVVLWILSLPLAMLGGWMAASRLSERSGVRIAVGVLWMLAPMFLAALVEGRPAAVLVHLLLPWLFLAASSARRSWGAAGAASLLLTAVLACAPSLAPAAVLVWAVALLLSGRGAGRVAWVLVPALALFAPSIWRRGVEEGDWWALLGDPALVWSGTGAAGSDAGRLGLVSGFPSEGWNGWSALVPDLLAGLPWAVAALLVPLAALALSALFTSRWLLASALTALTLAGVATAVGARAVLVQDILTEPVPLWPGAGLSLAWLGVVTAVAVALDAPVPRAVGAVRPWAAALVVLCVAVTALPALSAPLRGESELRKADPGLPAFVAAAGRAEPGLGSLVVTPLPGGDVSAQVVWGPGETLGGQTTLQSTRTRASAGDERLASLTAELVVPSVAQIADQLAAEGIRFVVLVADDDETEAAHAVRLRAASAIDERGGFERVGLTPRGELWRIAVAPTPPPAEAAGPAVAIGLAQLAVIAIALLLSLPTVASRRAARARPRVLGGAAEAAPRRRPLRTRRAALPASEDEAVVPGPEGAAPPAPASPAAEDRSAPPPPADDNDAPDDVSDPSADEDDATADASDATADDRAEEER